MSHTFLHSGICLSSTVHAVRPVGPRTKSVAVGTRPLKGTEKNEKQTINRADTGEHWVN